MNSTNAAAYVFAHRILRDEFAERLKLAAAEWREDREGYLRGCWSRALLATGDAVTARPALDRMPLVGSEHDWPDGTQALVVAMGSPQAKGEALYCGVLWKRGHENRGRYVLLERGDGQMNMMCTWHNGVHSEFGPAGAAGPEAFAAVAKMCLAHA